MTAHPHPRLEARAYALMATRRAFSQALAGLDRERLWAPVDERVDERAGESARSLGDLARAVWEREAYWLWPPEVPAPVLDARPDLPGLLYALVRHRGVTEELLMRSTDDDLDRVYVSDARLADASEPRTLGWILETIMREELDAAAEAATLRALIDPAWAGAREAWNNAAEAVANARAAD